VRRSRVFAGHVREHGTLERKRWTDYVRKEWVKETRQQIANYKKLKKLSGEWVSLSIGHAKLTMKLEHDQG